MSGADAAAAAEARVTVVVPIWNSARWLPGCLDALRRQSFRGFRLVVVDDGSTDGGAEIVRARWPEAEVVAFADNRGFARAVNAGIARATTPYVALLNADTRPEEGWLGALVARLDAGAEEIGAVASLMLRLDDPTRVDDAGDLLSWYGAARKRGHGEPAARFAEPVEVFSACAGAALYRRSLFAAVGPFDERFGSYFEDVDLGLRSRLAGFRCVYAPAARVLHQGQASGTPRGAYVALVTRNRLMAFAKSVPARLLLRHLGRLAFGQLYFFLAYRRPLRSLAGFLGFLRALPHVARERRRILASRAISDPALAAALTTDLGEPPLRALLRRRLRRAGVR